MKRLPVLFAILAALCYGISMPAAKLLLADMPPTFMAALLYLGAALSMAVVTLFQKDRAAEARITKKELPYTIGMVALDIAAPILLMVGLTTSTAGTASLLNNFETAATAVIALVVFREAIGKKMGVAIGVITLASVLLSVEDFGSLTFSTGALLILLASVCWGFENNLTSRLALKSPLQIVFIKGVGSGMGSLLIAFFAGGLSGGLLHIAGALALGFVAYGLSIWFYIRAQRDLGAARTSAFYAFAPFIGVGLSFAVFREAATLSFIIALLLMIFGAYLAAFEKHEHEHHHPVLEHEHRHSHSDGHHDHVHEPPFAGEHSHAHTHAERTHSHPHTPDSHHTHTH